MVPVESVLQMLLSRGGKGKKQCASLSRRLMAFVNESILHQGDLIMLWVFRQPTSTYAPAMKCTIRTCELCYTWLAYDVTQRVCLEHHHQL